MYLSSISSRLALHDVNSWELRKVYGSGDGILRDITWSDDGKYLLQVNHKGLIEILTATDQEIRSLQHVPLRDTWSASFHRDGHKYVAIGTKTGNVSIWDTKTKNISKTFPTPTHQSTVNFVSFNAKNTSLAATLQNGETIIYGLVSNIPTLTVKLNCSRSVSAMKFHHESRALLGLATDEGHVILRDINTNKDKAYFENSHASPVSDFSFSPINKDVMLSSGYDNMVHVYDIRLKGIVSTLKTSCTLTSLSLNIESQVALGTKNGKVLLYDLRDITKPFKVLKNHEHEVSKVSFQPLRKKVISNEISLREDTGSTNIRVSSPTKNRTSDLFFVSDSPPKSNLNHVSVGANNSVDSFLVMIGLDKTNNDIDDENNKSSEFDLKSDKIEARYRQLDAEKNISKVSTPLNSRIAENFGFPSPIVENGTSDVYQGVNLSNLKELNNRKEDPPSANIDLKTIDELKDFVKLCLADVADDNRNNYLNIMMALTKQKLYLEKSLAVMNDQIQNLMQNQNTLVEINRKLALELDLLKNQKTLP